MLIDWLVFATVVWVSLICSCKNLLTIWGQQIPEYRIRDAIQLLRWTIQLKLYSCSFIVQYFEHVEEAEWAVQVLMTTGKPVAASLCIGPEGDLNGVSPGECAARLVKAGMYSMNQIQLGTDINLTTNIS